MITIGFKVDRADIDRLTKNIEKQVAKIAENVAVKTYNAIVTNPNQFPYYSGAYISSWTVQAGSPDMNYNTSDWVEGQYSVPQAITSIGGVSYGKPIYISNNAGHAYQVEVMGTPLHPHEGWFTAAHAVNQTVLGYSFDFKF